eukprot:TRINITY_DN2564_c0_g1_i5.p1 TRINITY_DN2564_c0_g1~~TRINITY_DN2564_c0_g1_i5.p1  ORF type:complete len:529 (-),score=80.82 TRINITY_DN2564_c0_g1_i5:513-2099(-)
MADTAFRVLKGLQQLVGSGKVSPISMSICSETSRPFLNFSATSARVRVSCANPSTALCFSSLGKREGNGFVASRNDNRSETQLFLKQTASQGKIKTQQHQQKPAGMFLGDSWKRYKTYENDNESESINARSAFSSGSSIPRECSEKPGSLSSLTEMTKDWACKVSFSFIGELTPYSSSKGVSIKLEMEVTDEVGTKMQAIVFGNNAIHLKNEIEVCFWYEISGATIKQIPSKFRKAGQKYEMIFTKNTKISKLHDNLITFTTFDEFDYFANMNIRIDVIGLLVGARPYSNNEGRKDNSEPLKAEIYIGDQRSRIIQVILWEDVAIRESKEMVAKVESHPVLLITALKVSRLGGIFLSSTKATRITQNPNIKEAAELRKWAEDIYKEPKRAVIRDRHGKEMRKGNMVDLLIRKSSNDRVIYNICAFFKNLKAEQVQVYKGCNFCNRKVYESEDNNEQAMKVYTCSFCKEAMTSFTPRYRIRTQICDDQAFSWITIFGKEAERIIGCPLKEMHQKMQEVKRTICTRNPAL